jgi:hypothetical protein
MASGSGGKGGGGMGESRAGLPAMFLFTKAVQVKLEGLRHSIEDKWERAVAKKAIKAKEYVVKEGDSLLKIAEGCVRVLASCPPPPLPSSLQTHRRSFLCPHNTTLFCRLFPFSKPFPN